MSGHPRSHGSGVYHAQSHDMHPAAHVDHPQFLSMPAMRYQGAYLVLVLVSALDIVFTWCMIQLCNAQEINPVAAAVIDTRGLIGMVMFKFGLIMLVILLCEIVGRRNEEVGRRLSIGLVLIGSLPVLYAFAALCDILPPSMIG